MNKLLMENQVTVNTSQRCTELINLMTPGSMDLEMTFEKRSKSFPVDLFPAESTISTEAVLSSLKNILETEIKQAGDENTELKQQLKKRHKSQTHKIKKNLFDRLMTPGKKAFQRRRQKIIDIHKGTDKLTYSDIAKLVGCSYQTVKSTLATYALVGEEASIVLPSATSLKKFAEIKRITEDKDSPFLTVAHIKRELNQAGRPISHGYISRVLKMLGYRYCQTENKRPRVVRKLMEAEEWIKFKELVARILAEKQSGKVVLFSDEFKCVSSQVPVKFWKLLATQPDLSRFSGSKVYTIAFTCLWNTSCSAMIFEKELRVPDYEYFICSTLKQLGTAGIKDFVIVQDGPAWHELKNIRQHFGNSIIKTLPSRFESNLAELHFAKLRYLYRHRPNSRTEDEELALIVKLLSACNRPVDYAGYRKHFFTILKNIVIEKSSKYVKS